MARPPGCFSWADDDDDGTLDTFDTRALQRRVEEVEQRNARLHAQSLPPPSPLPQTPLPQIDMVIRSTRSIPSEPEPQSQAPPINSVSRPKRSRTKSVTSPRGSAVTLSEQAEVPSRNTHQNPPAASTTPSLTVNPLGIPMFTANRSDPSSTSIGSAKAAKWNRFAAKIDASAASDAADLFGHMFSDRSDSRGRSCKKTKKDGQQQEGE